MKTKAPQSRQIVPDARLTRGVLIAYCVLAGLLSVWVLVLFGLNYSALPLGVSDGAVPVYLAPWGGALGTKAKSLFYMFRMPVMALCLQGMLLGLYPDRMEGWPDEAYRYLRILLVGLSVVTLSQLTLNPYYTFFDAGALRRGIMLCATLAGGLTLAVLGYMGLRRVLKARCTGQQTPFALLLDFIVAGCRRRRWLLIAAVAAFMVLLVIPSL